MPLRESDKLFDHYCAFPRKMGSWVPARIGSALQTWRNLYFHGERKLSNSHKDSLQSSLILRHNSDMSTSTKPPYDKELAPILPQLLAQLSMPSELHVDMLPKLRSTQQVTAQDVIGSRPVEYEELTISGPNGDILIAILRPTNSKAKPNGRSGIYNIHSGGMIMGNRYTLLEESLDWVVEFDAICITPEYRLAPEHPDPVPVEDCYAVLQWIGTHLEELDINPERLMIAGASAGGGLAAGVALLARDRGGPALCAQVLQCPMLDDRCTSISAKQFSRGGLWDNQTNITGWTALLGDRRATDSVSIYAAPNRAIDLTGLPPTFIDVGSAEVFRDEDVQFASKLWACGVEAELHVWPGGFHGFSGLVKTQKLSQLAIQSRNAWVKRMLLQ